MTRMKKEYEKQLSSKNQQIRNKDHQLHKEKKKYNNLVKSRSYKLIKIMKKIYKCLFRR